MPVKPLFVILDGYSMAYRHYHGTQKQNLSAPDGTPTGAIFGFSRQILDIILKDQPRYLAVTFDAGLSGREILYPEYKAQRTEAPDDFDPQVQHIKAMLQALNVPILELAGYEADDVIGTMVRKAEAAGVHSRIITGDGDLLQLITDDTDVFLMRPFGGPKLYDEAAFREKYDGLAPHQLLDYKALRGDSSDNIPGVRGIGEKTAIPLIKQYNNLQSIYDRLDEIKGATRKKLEKGRDDAFMSLQLVTIQCDLDLHLDLEACVTKDYDPEAAVQLFEHFGFSSLIRQLRKSQMPPPQSDAPPSQMSMFGDDISVQELTEDDVAAGAFGDVSEFAVPIHANDLVETAVVLSEAGLQQLVNTLNRAKLIAFDTETTGLDPLSAELVGISLSVDGEQGYYIPVGHVDAVYEQLPLATVIDALRKPLEDPAIGKVAHNASYDLSVLLRYGIEVKPVTFDTMIAEWVRGNSSGNVDERKLSRLALRPNLLAEHGVLMQDIADLIGTGKKQITMAAVPITKAAPYAAQDAAITYRLVAPLQKALQQADKVGYQSNNLFETIEMPLVPVIVAMEQAGVLLDVKHLQNMSIQLKAQLSEIEREIHSLSGGYGAFNINSPKQLNDVLFGKLDLPRQGIRKTTHGYSTAADVLEKLYNDTGHPILEKILEHRELTKLKGTYVDALPELVNSRTGRLHTSFNQTGTSTGRLSSSQPNLQNIPIRTEIGREVRRAFITPAGSRLLAVDYSQVELRIMAHKVDEPYLKQAFAAGQDIHAATAAIVNDISVEQVTYEQRSFAKRVNFGLLYGMGAFRLARDSDLTLAEADAFVKTYFERLPNVKHYIESTKEQIRVEGYVETLLGRRRYFGDLRKMSRVEQGRVEREAINMPIQGTAADIIKKAMIDLHHELRSRKLRAKLMLQVHDELVLEVPEAELNDTSALVVEIMENAYPLDPRLKANAQVGENWRDMEPISV